MPDLNSLGGQLYARLAQLLAPAESLGDTPSCLVLLEPAGKTIGAIGSLPAAAKSEAVAAFVNAIPAAAPTFLDSGNYYDDTWDFILTSAALTGAVDDPVSTTVSNLIADNRFDFEATARASAEPGLTYHPVQTVPTEWLDDVGWANVSFTLGGEHPEPAPAPPQAVFIPEEIPDLTWTIENQTISLNQPQPPPVVDPVLVQPPRLRIIDTSLVDPPEKLTARVAALHQDVRLEMARSLRRNNVLPELDVAPWKDLWALSRADDAAANVADTDPQTSGFHIDFEYRLVGVRRPWLRPQLCNLSGWLIPGLAAPISDGKPVKNTGLMPLITTRMLVVRNLTVKAAWSEADRARAQDAASISFGPFSITGGDAFDGARLIQPSPQVVAWLATVVPECPKATD
jgi:hypothetical protein